MFRKVFLAVIAATLSTGWAMNVAASPSHTRSYAVTLPEEWRGYVAAGPLTVLSEPFPGIRHKSFGMCPVVEVDWFIQNLSREPIFIKVNYRSPSPKGPGKTGFGVAYILPPLGKQPIHDIIPVFSGRFPVTLQVVFDELRLPGKRMLLASPYNGATTDPLQVSREPGRDIAGQQKNKNIVVRSVRPDAGVDGSTLKLVIENLTAVAQHARIEVSVGDPLKTDWGICENPLSKSGGSYSETTTALKPNSSASLRVPYSVPSDAGDAPVLALRVFMPLKQPSPETAERLNLSERDLSLLRGGDLIYAGCIDLKKMAATEQAKLPPSVPVEERAKLTAEKRSEHFLFRYRPDSYAARNINKVVTEREDAYKRLSALLGMVLPVSVTIDLYPDMEAKGLGSGTKWTPGNTVNNRHIAEVYNESTLVDPAHELAHIFTFHFGGGGEGLCEAFAVYCESDADIAASTQRLQLKLDQGSIEPLRQTLSSLQDESLVFIDYLLKRDLGSFKRFYAGVSQGKDSDECSRGAYGISFQQLEGQWRDYLARIKG